MGTRNAGHSKGLQGFFPSKDTNGSLLKIRRFPSKDTKKKCKYLIYNCLYFLLKIR